MAFALVIFDCDGVLVDSEPLAMRAMREVLNDAGVPATEAMVLRCFGMKQADTLAWIGKETGHDIPDSVAPRLWPAVRSMFEAALRPMPGVAEVLARMGPAKRCVCSSSHPDRIRLSLSLTGLDGFFGEAIFSSHQVARGKPAPDLFLLAATTMGVAPAQCAVIEDSTFGIVGARAAGMAAYGFNGGGHVGPGHAQQLIAAGAESVASDWPAMARFLMPQGEGPTVAA